MTTIAELGIAVNSESVVQATGDLDRMVDSGKGAEDSAKRVESAWAKAVSGISSDTSQIVKELQQLNSRQDATAQLMAKLAQSVTAASSAFTSASSSAQSMAAAEAKVGETADQAKARLLALATAAVEVSKSQESVSRAYDATAGSAAAAARAQLDQLAAQSTAARLAAESAAAQEKAASSTHKASAATADDANALAKLVAQIDPTVAGLKRLDAQQDLLSKSHELGLLSNSDFEKYSTNIDQARTNLSRFEDGLNKTGISAKQNAAALRTLPAQFSDIATSLQAGQAPLTVFMQQGSQIKDSFGGVGAAANAMAGYIVGLINPFTVAAVAVGALGIAFYEGSKEAAAYREALTSNGNAAGTTADALASLANKVSSTVGTTGEAADALAQLAASGKIARANFEEVATAAVASQEATGRAVSETISEFVKIADDPVAAAKSLNDQYNFLTAAVYQQLVALKEQGKEQEAATLLTDKYSEAVRARAVQVTANLGTIERAWASISLETRKTIDAALNVGRVEDSAKKIVDLTQKVAAAQSALNADPDDTANKEKLANSKLELEYLTKERDAQAAIAAAQGNTDERQRKSIDALASLHTDYLGGLDKEAKKKLDIEALDRKRADALKGEGVNLAQINKEYDVSLKAINDKYKETPKTGAVDLTSFNDAENVLKSLVASYDNSFKLLDASEKAGLISADDYALQKGALLEKEKGDVEAAYQAEIAALEAVSSKSSTTGAQRIGIDQKIADARQKMVDALKKLDTDQEVLSQQTSARNARDEAALKAFTQNVQDSLALAQQGLDNQLAGIGLGKEARQRLQDDLKIRQDYQKQIEKLNRDYAAIVNPTEGQTSNYNKETQNLKDALAQRLAAQQDYYVQLQKYQSDWTNGANAAFQDYIDEASNISSQTYTLFSDSLHGIEEAFVDLATSGKLSFKNLADSIIADLARMAAKAYVVVPLLAALGLGGSTSGLSGVAGSAASAVGSSFNISDAFNKASAAFGLATSSFAKSISTGYSSGGIPGAFSGGSDFISGLFSSGSSAVGTGSTAAGYTSNAFSSWVGTQNALSYSVSGLTQAISGLGGAIYGYGQSGVKGAIAGGLGGWGGSLLGGAAGSAAGAYVGGTLGSIIPVAGTILGAAIGSFVGGSLFGGKWQTKDQGLQLGVSSGELDANSFEYQKKKGGLFGSNKSRTKLGELDADTSAALDATYDKTEKGVLDLVSKIGIDLPQSIFDGMSLAAQQISTKGKSQEEIQTALSAAFGSFADQMIAYIDMGTQGFGYSFEELAQRVANFTSFNAALELINVQMLKLSPTSMELANSLITAAGGMETFTTNINTYYDKFTSDTDKASDALAAVQKQFKDMNVSLPETRDGYKAMVEGIDLTTDAGQKLFLQLTASASAAASAYDIIESRQSTYYGAFYSEAENTARSMASITAELKKANIALPDSRSGYRSMVEGIDQTTEAGKKMYQTLMAMSGDADTFYTAQEQATVTSVNNAMSALQRAVNGQKTALTDAYNAQVASLNDTAATAQQSISDLTSIGNSLESALKSLNGTSDTTVKMLRAQAQATLQSALAMAQAGGSLSGFTGLSDALSTVSSNSTDLYSSLEDFNRDQGRTANVVAQLNAINGVQLTTEQQLLKTVQNQIDDAKEQYDAQIAVLDAQLDTAQKQLDALNGVDNSVMSVAAALNAFNAAVQAAIAAAAAKPAASAASSGGSYTGGTGTAGAPSYSDLNSIYQSVLGRDADAAGATYWAGQAATMSAAQLAAAIKADAQANGELPKYATGGLISGPGNGTSDSILARLSNGEYVMSADAVRMFGSGMLDQMNAGIMPAFAMDGGVGEDGPTLEVTRPSQVYSLGSSQSRNQSSDSDAATAAELSALREEVRTGLAAIVLHAKKTSENTGQLAEVGTQVIGTAQVKVVA